MTRERDQTRNSILCLHSDPIVSSLSFPFSFPSLLSLSLSLILRRLSFELSFSLSSWMSHSVSGWPCQPSFPKSCLVQCLTESEVRPQKGSQSGRSLSAVIQLGSSLVQWSPLSLHSLPVY